MKYLNEFNNIIKNDIKKIKEFLLNNYNFIIDLFFILSLILITFLDVPEVAGLIILIIIYILLNITKKVIKKSNIEFPILNKELTETDKNGNIKVKQGDLQKVIIYCNSIEKYIKRMNLR